MPALAVAGENQIFAWGEAPSTVDLSGNGTGVDGAPIVGWLWTIQSAPDGVSPVFADTGTTTSNLQDVTLTSWGSLGDVVISLVVIDDDGNVSETTYENMPQEAIVVVGVTTQYAALRVLSEWEMFWADAQVEWVLEIDRLSGVVSQLSKQVVRPAYMRSPGASGDYASSAAGPGTLVFPGTVNIADGFAVSLWVRIEPLVAATAANKVICTLTSDGTPSLTMYANTYDLDVDIVDDTSSATVSNTKANVFTDGKWHHICVTGVHDAARVYVDAVLAFTLAPAGNYAQATGMTLFADSLHANRLACDLAGIAVFDTQIDADSISALYQGGRVLDLMASHNGYTDRPVYYYHNVANELGVVGNAGTGPTCNLTLANDVITLTENDNTVWSTDTGLSFPAGAKIEGPTGLTLDFPGGLVGTLGPTVLASSGLLSFSAGDDSTWNFAGVDVDFTLDNFNITGTVKATDVWAGGTSVKPQAVYTNEAKTNADAAEHAYTAVRSMAAMAVGDEVFVMVAHDITANADGGTRSVKLKIAGVTVATDSGSLAVGTTQMWGLLICTGANTFSFIGWHNFNSASSVVADVIHGQTGVGSAFDISVSMQFSVGGGNNATNLKLLRTKRGNA